MYIETIYRSQNQGKFMHKTQCDRCGNEDAGILRRGKYASDVLFCPHCDDIGNKL